MPRIPHLTLALFASALLACQSGPEPSDTGGASPSVATDRIQLNQVGYPPAAAKEALVPPGASERFDLIDADTGETVFTGELGSPAIWPPSGEPVRRADFSEFREPGRYRLRVEGLGRSVPFVIEAGLYGELNRAATKAFYYNRASTALEPEHAGDYARPAGHPDDNVRVHRSAASEARPEGTRLSSPKGWYDAGDYNKYIVNSGISVYTLLAAWEHFPEVYRDRALNIPESGDSVPDLLDEIQWNLQWMLTMQDPNDGGVYHKLTTLDFSDKVMPHEADAPRYVVAKGTSAALNFAAVMASASRIYEDFDGAYPDFSERALSAAKRAWEWAQANPDETFTNPEGVHTGEYGDGNLSDEFVWAAAELYLATDEARYAEAIDPEAPVEVPSWSNAVGQPWLSLMEHRERLAPELRAAVENKVRSMARLLHSEWRASAAGVPMRRQDFVWGSNGVAMNSAMMLLAGHRLTGERGYLDAAQSLVDYVLGRNPTGYSFVTGFGDQPPMHIHHRPSAADDIEAPVPGFLAGGPHSGQQDAVDCPVDYPSDRPARSYLDHWCSYSTNEITINWNAPLVYVTGALEVLYAEQ